ncbi:hypothetical protein BDQ17DRAFT_1418119 [Cyathus striatus]|nr:hypothetical protein BDQ17DRAFT_1418119 [Cyathus striatus]
MRISFTPALGDRFTISDKPSSGLQSPSTTIQFSATLSESDYVELKRTGAKVQLWTNIPQGGRSLGEWSEHDFQDESQYMEDNPIDATSGDLAELVHLVSKEGEEERHPVEHIDHCGHLRLCIPIPADIGTGSQTLLSEFTYRIVYSSGEIKWLGHYGYNGTLVLENGKAGQIALTSQDGWTFNSSDASCIYNIPEGVSGVVRIAQLADPSAYQLWAFENDNFLPHCKNASLVLVTPRAPALRALVIPDLYILSASSGALVSIDYSGNITACGDGTVSVYTYSYGSTSAATSWISDHLLERCRVAHIVSSGKDYALLAPIGLMKETLRKTLILPLNFVPTNQIVRIPLTILSHMLGTDSSTPLIILSSNNLDVHFFQPPSSTGPAPEVDIHFAFLVDPSGSQISASPTHILYASRNNNGKASLVEWSASILCPFTFIESPDAGDAGGILPTPPPSPRLKSAELQPRLSRRKSDDCSGLTEPFLSDAAVVTSIETGPHGSRDHTSRTLVVCSHEMSTSSGLFAYIKYIFAMAGILLELFYKIFFEKEQDVAESDGEGEAVVPKGPSQPHMLNEPGQLSPSSASSGTANLAQPDSDCEESLNLFEGTSLPSRSGTSEDMLPKAKDTTVIVQGIQSKTDSRSSSLFQTSPPIRVQIGDTETIIVAIKMRISSPDSNVDSAISPLDSSEILKSISLNGVTPQVYKVKSRQVRRNASVMEHIYLLEFNGGRGDWLNLSAPYAVVDL